MTSSSNETYPFYSVIISPSQIVQSCLQVICSCSRACRYCLFLWEEPRPASSIHSIVYVKSPWWCHRYYGNDIMWSCVRSRPAFTVSFPGLPRQLLAQIKAADVTLETVPGILHRSCTAKKAKQVASLASVTAPNCVHMSLVPNVDLLQRSGELLPPSWCSR